MPLLSPILKQITGTIPDTYYLRDSDLDANIDIDLINIEGLTLVIYNNLQTVVHDLPEGGGTTTTRSWPVELKILQLADLDDDGDGGDIIRGACLAIADTIFDRLIQDPLLSQIKAIDGYDVSFEDNVKIFDKMLTGCTLSLIFPIDRITYDCSL